MANYGTSVNLHVFSFPKEVSMINRYGALNRDTENIKDIIEEILNIDSDFGENEEYFRDDTISMGYRSESHRCANEIYEKVKDIKDEDIVEAIIEEVIGYSFEGEDKTTVFLIGNSSYCGDYTYEIRETLEAYLLSIAYVN